MPDPLSAAHRATLAGLARNAKRAADSQRQVARELAQTHDGLRVVMQQRCRTTADVTRIAEAIRDAVYEHDHVDVVVLSPIPPRPRGAKEQNT